MIGDLRARLCNGAGVFRLDVADLATFQGLTLQIKATAVDHDGRKLGILQPTADRRRPACGAGRKNCRATIPRR